MTERYGPAEAQANRGISTPDVLVITRRAVIDAQAAIASAEKTGLPVPASRLVVEIYNGLPEAERAAVVTRREPKRVELPRT
jgi:hypothetical protein